MNPCKLLKSHPAILGTVFCVLACLCGTAYFALSESRSNYESVLSGQALSVSAMIDSRLQRLVSALTVLSLDPSLDDLQAAQSVGLHGDSLSKSVGGRVVIFASGETPRVVYDSLYQDGAPRDVGNGYSFKRSFLATSMPALMERHYAISNLHFGWRLSEHTVIVLVPVIRHDRMIGAIALSLFGDQLADLLRPTDVPGRQFATLVDGNHRVVDRSRGARSERTGWPVPDWMENAMSQARHGVLGGVGMSGIDNVMAFQQLSVAPDWHVIVGEPKAIINHFFLTPLLWVAIGGLCAFVALAWWILAWRQRFLRDTDILRTQKSRLSRLSRNMPAVQFLCDVQPDGTYRVSYIGGDFPRVTGRGWDEAATVAQWDRLRAPDARPLRDIMKSALADGSALHEFRIHQADGSWRWLRSEITRIAKNPDGSGEVVGYIISVDETRKAQQQAAAAVHLASVGKIAASLSSEIRRPLSAANIAAEILEQELASGDTAHAKVRVEQIKGKIGSALHAHDQMRRFATNRGATASLCATSIDGVVTRVLDAVVPVLREDNIDVWVNIPPLECPDVIANAVDFEQVLTCVLLNARDAIMLKDPGVERRVCVEAVHHVAAETVSIRISDNGGGIPDDLMPRLFEPFVTTKKDAGALGLDLAICGALMARMNGAIDARNDDNGAVFTIVLPAVSHGADTGLAQAS